MSFSNTSGNYSEDISRSHSASIWIVDMTITCFSGVTSLYVLVALAVYEARRFAAGTARKRTPTERKLSNFMRALCLIVAAMATTSSSLKITGLALEHRAAFHPELVTELEKAQCKTIPRVREVLISLATGFCYLFLWARQSIFYLSPSLALLNNAKVKFFSITLLVCWIVYYVPAIVVQFALVHFDYFAPGGCLAVEASLPIFKIVLITWVVVSVLTQVALLGLFIYPILNRASIKGYRDSKSTGSTRSYQRVFVRVKRAVILTAICLLSDSISAAITIALHRKNTNHVTSAYCFNLTVNLLAIVGCFDNRRRMLWPWMSWRGLKSVPTQTSSAGTTAPAQSLFAPPTGGKSSDD